MENSAAGMSRVSAYGRVLYCAAVPLSFLSGSRLNTRLDDARFVSIGDDSILRAAVPGPWYLISGPMTKNNLEFHLKWLLDRGPSLYRSLNSSTRNSAVLSQSVPANPPVDTFTGTRTYQPATEVKIEGERDHGLDVNPLFESNQDMGRLSFAPQSESKPRMLIFQNDNAPPRTVKTPKRREENTPVKLRGSQNKPPIKGRPLFMQDMLGNS